MTQNGDPGFFCISAFVCALLYNIVIALLHLLFSVARLWVVVFPFDNHFKSPAFVFKIIVLLALTSLAITVLYTSLTLAGTDVATRLCLPFLNLPTWEVNLASIFLFVVQVTAVAIITVSYIIMIRGLKQSHKLAGQKSDVGSGIYIQFCVFVLCCVSSWIPASVVYIVAPHIAQNFLEVSLWATIFGMSVNALCNPVVFFVIMRKK